MIQKIKELFTLSWKKFGITVIAFVVSVILHNLLSASIGVEEPVFFIIAVIILPLYLIIAIIYSLIRAIVHRHRRF